MNGIMMSSRIILKRPIIALLISAKETLGLSLADCTDGLTEAMTQIIDEYKKAQKKDKEDED